MTEGRLAGLDDALLRHAPDRAVAAFFAPLQAREALASIYDFDDQIARVSHAVSTPIAGQVRLAWWREQIDAIHSGRPVASPVLEALARTVRQFAIPRAWLDACVDARERDLVEVPFVTLDDLTANADAAQGGIMRMGLRVLGTSADSAVRPAATASFIAEALGDFVPLLERRKCRLPRTWFDEAGISVDGMMDGDVPFDRLAPVFATAKAAIVASLSAANGRTLPWKGMPVLAAASCARWAARDVFDPAQVLRMSDWQRVRQVTISRLMRRL